MDDETRRIIGPLRAGTVPRELIRNPEPLRLHDVTEHPRSYGFLAGHPPMTTSSSECRSPFAESAYGNLI